MINKIALLIIAAVLGLSAIFMVTIDNDEKPDQRFVAEYEVLKKWELPAALEEISGIAWLDDSRIICVQDEDGVIFIYNLLDSKIESKIEFGGGGDYEGITLNGSTVYVVESNGTITEVKNFQQQEPEISKIETGLTGKQNIESIFMDQQQNRLLLAVKDKDSQKSSKGIYEYDLKNGNFRPEPAFRINMTDEVFSEAEEKELSKVMSPSDLAIHPVNGKIYVLEGTNPKILILNSSGDAEKIVTLNKEDFDQPEGITFSPSGKMYISNEGEPANIMEVKLNETN